MNNRVLVVFSGGQDSTTCLFKAINDYGKNNIELITFSYGQRHKIEIEKSIFIANDLGLRQNIIETNIFSQIKDNALLDDKLPIVTDNKYPNTFVEGRNALFILLAASYAKSLDIQDIIIGVCETDYSGYPDCRAVFIKSMNTSINLAMDYDFNLITPLMYLTKEQTWQLADKLGCIDYIIKHTHTCYLGIEGGCHNCPSCKLREEGLKKYLANNKI